MRKRKARSTGDPPRCSELTTDCICWLCHRPLGVRVEYHHPVPKSRGGRTTVPVHPICHRTLHVALTNVELARLGDDPQALANNEVVGRFLRWIADKPPDFNAPTRRKR